MGNFGLNAEVPWFWNTESRALFVLYAKNKDNVGHFPLECQALALEIMLNLSGSI